MLFKFTIYGDEMQTMWRKRERLGREGHPSLFFIRMRKHIQRNRKTSSFHIYNNPKILHDRHTHTVCVVKDIQYICYLVMKKKKKKRKEKKKK